MKIMVSGCLLGENCKYNGLNNFSQKVMDFIKGHEIFSVCPEVMGGLSIPRPPAEIVDGIVKIKEGKSVDKEFRHGAQLALEIAVKEKVDCVILQSRSPSCGSKQIYDGTFSGTKIPGQGTFASLLKEHGFKIIDVEDL